MVELSEKTFAEYTASTTVVIDFWAEWCGPCKTLGPVFVQVADKMKSRATFAKLNVDEAPGVAGACGVMSIPTILVMRDGTEIGRLIGSRPAEQLQSELDSILA